jgi:hypothetical protein
MWRERKMKGRGERWKGRSDKYIGYRGDIDRVEGR